ncbi:DNA translocase FtsK 4TM domain-containing protein [Psychrobacter sp. NG254]|uniref:DNA translocase FtsK n=1 Tax=Psychrobacter sp. NG254 TaxID=2782003 RepID=UPI0018874A3B|nr:DNA translocase FtsK 4TM domain-containing protein [Psychrobacter sp. NG254]MBF2720609.1 DNA translocase FtsK 4TM domain-containing protein [Psychrobacter sp. NG254]
MISAPLIEYLKKGIFTLLGLILAVYLFVILMTYTGNDPSWSHISSDMTTINNMGGQMGAWLSDLLYSFFGFGAWWFFAFVVYESILIWWNNKPTFWLMRLVAYVFLLLSASALFAQLVALVQHMTNPASTGLEGVAGGIIGLELQERLAQLLSQWGSVVFLAVFVAITSTFAFNVHWLAIYQKITALSWLGSGIKNKDTAQNSHSDESRSNGLNDDSTLDGSTLNDTTSQKAEHEQLPLELQPAEHASNAQAFGSGGRFGHALSDFLTTSGLADSVKASLAVAKEAATSSHQKEPQASTAANSSGNSNNSSNDDTNNAMSVSTPSPAVAPNRKVEPSFAWNDVNTVDDLLAREQMAHSTDSTDSFASPIPNYASSQTSTYAALQETLADTSVSQSATYDEESIFQPAVNEVINTATISQDIGEGEVVVSDTELGNETDTDSKSVDKLAEAWLAEHADISDPVTIQAVETKAPTIQAATTQTVDSVQKEVIEQPVAKISTPVPEPTPQPVSKPVVEVTTDYSDSSEHQPSNEADVLADNDEAFIASEATVASVQSEVAPVVPNTLDMTPTNTPPANPTLPPTAKSVAVVESMTETVTAPKANVSFDIPEGDSSNHIADMMPDDTSADVAAPVMPDISDDAAFSTKSRSMQTAAYRSSLTPIPEMSILDKPDPDRQPSYTDEKLVELSELLEIKLQEFNVKASVVNAIPGPVVTRFEVELAAGVKASKVTGISRDLARSLSMASLRVVEVIPGKPYIGIEVPNPKREMVRLIELLNTEKFKDPKAQISMAMGKDIGGKPIITDLARAPHMLVAGTTGSGKSVLVNSMLLSMLLKYTPNELRLILIDPKQLELANYNDIPHLLTPVVTDMTEAASALSWCVAEMERRYQLMSLLKVRKLDEFNKKVRAAEASGNPMLDPLWRPNDSVSISQAPKLKTLPMIVIVADEFADMIMQVGKQAEELITRLAQKSRAAGIHLMLATQRPSVDVITGLIKANIPVRAALRVNSKVDSRTILDSGGAEDMLGNGDMLFLGPGQIEPDRVHGAYVSDEEVNRVCDAWRERGAPDYIDNMAGNFELSSPGGSSSSANASGEDDDLYNDAVAFIMETRKVSASSIQRKFSIGYNRAARIVDSMEEAGLVSSMGKSGKRELLM